MNYTIIMQPSAEAALAELEADAGLAKVLKAVRGALGKLETNPNHPSLNVHPWKGKTCGHDKSKTLFEAYAQNNTPGAYRIFFCYCNAEGARGTINVWTITPHP